MKNEKTIREKIADVEEKMPGISILLGSRFDEIATKGYERFPTDVKYFLQGKHELVVAKWEELYWDYSSDTTSRMGTTEWVDYTTLMVMEN